MAKKMKWRQAKQKPRNLLKISICAAWRKQYLMAAARIARWRHGKRPIAPSCQGMKKRRKIWHRNGDVSASAA